MTGPREEQDVAETVEEFAWEEGGLFDADDWTNDACDEAEDGPLELAADEGGLDVATDDAAEDGALLEPPEETGVSDVAEELLFGPTDEFPADEQNAHCGRPGLDTQQPQVVQELEKDDDAAVVQVHEPAVHWPKPPGHVDKGHAVLGGA